MRGLFRAAQDLENIGLAPPSPHPSQLSVSMTLSEGPDPEPTVPARNSVARQSDFIRSTSTPPPQTRLSPDALAARIAKSFYSYNPFSLLDDEPDGSSDDESYRESDHGSDNTSSDDQTNESGDDADSEILSDAPTPSEDTFSQPNSLKEFFRVLPLMSDTPIPDVLSHDRIPSYDRNSEYLNLHTPAEKNTLYCGFRSGADEASERIKIDVSLDSEPCPTIRQCFDRDSLVAFADSIAVAANGLNIYTQQALVSNMTSNLHLPTWSIPADIGDADSDEHTRAAHPRRVRVDFIPNFCLGRFIGDDNITINIFFPRLFDVTKHHDESHDGRGRKLTDAQYHKFIDQVLLPALYTDCSAAINQEYPSSGRHAQSNSQAKYSELRSRRIDAVPRQQALAYPIAADRLSVIQGIINKRAKHPSNPEFRDSFLLLNAKGLKLDHVKSHNWETMADRLRRWHETTFNVQYLHAHTTFVDIAQTIVPDHTSIPTLQDRLGRSGQSLFWRETYLRRFFQWLDKDSTDGKKKQPTFWPIGFLKHISGATNEYPQGSDLHDHGLLYVQFYSSFKNIVAAANTNAFQNKDIPNIAIGKSQIDQLQRLAGTLSVDVQCLIRAYLHCKTRCHQALTASVEKSFGLRQEYRISWSLFLRIDAEMSRLNTVAACSSFSPFQLGWIALPTQRMTHWYRWNLNKFCFGFEMLHCFSPDHSIPWDHSRVMLLFLMCLPAFLGGEHPRTMPRLWQQSLSTKTHQDSCERGLGIGLNRLIDGYGWLDPVIDFHTLTFRTEYTYCIGFNTLPIFGNFRKRYHSAAGYWQDMIVVRTADQWLNQFSTDKSKRHLIAELFRQICLRAFRRDVYATIKKDITPRLRPQALRGNYPLTEDILERILHPEAAGITFTAARNQTIREYHQLFRILWEDNESFQRGTWTDHAGYRTLYRVCREILTSKVGGSYSDQWRSDLREYLRQTHWLLPYPGQTLVSRDAKGRSRWWSNFNAIINTFNDDAIRANSSNILPADIMKEWPTVKWDNYVQDFRTLSPPRCPIDRPI